MSDIVDAAPLFQPDAKERLDDAINRVTDLYAKCVTQGDRETAEKHLAVHRREHVRSLDLLIETADGVADCMGAGYRLEADDRTRTTRRGRRRPTKGTRTRPGVQDAFQIFLYYPHPSGSITSDGKETMHAYRYGGFRHSPQLPDRGGI